MKKDPFQPLLSLLKILPENTRILVHTIIYAIMAGVSAICFMTALNYVFDNTFVVFSTKSKPFFLIASLILVVGSSLIVGILLYGFNPEAAGSGIPQLKAAYWKDLGYVPLGPIVLKFIAGILSIGGGASLGREGPTVYIGGGIASNMAEVMGTPAR